MKRLLGKSDIEDGLKKLDKLTQEEARMATAEVLKVTQRVDEKVTVLIDGAQDAFFLAIFALPNTDLLDGKEAKAIMRQNVDEEKCSSSLIQPLLVLKVLSFCSEGIEMGPSKVTLFSGPVDKPQYCAQGPLQGNSNVVFRRKYVRRVEVISCSSLGSWKAYVSSCLRLLHVSLTAEFEAGSGKSVLWYAIFRSHRLLKFTSSTVLQ